MNEAGLDAWIAQTLGAAPRDPARYVRALTHGSQGSENYEKLEFLGDRVLGLAMAEWLYEAFPAEAEGALASRLAALCSGHSCAVVARALGVRQWLRLGKQARDDGAADSDNVLGDVMEALIGAVFLDHGLEGARTLIRKGWASMIHDQPVAPKHPKAELQEWAAARNRKPPLYEITDRSGPDHAPRFTVRVTIGKLASAEGKGGSKQEAETAAAVAMLDTVAK